MRNTLRESFYQRKCSLCGINQVGVLLLNNHLPKNQRLLCDSCYQLFQGSEASIRYDNALREIDEKRQIIDNYND